MKFEGMILDWLSQPKLQSSTRNTLDSRLSSRWPGQGKKRGKYNLIQGRNSDNHVSLFCTHEQASETVGDESILAEDLEICKQEFEPGLYLVSTPIGNLGDITLRALKVLRSSACIFVEDTRRSSILLRAFSIKCPLISCHLHNEGHRVGNIVERISQGEVVALVTDAGTPCVSDPGLEIVQAVLEHGLPVVPIPGASAVMTALVGSGLDTRNFLFVGFLPKKPGARKKRLSQLKAYPATIVMYVSPHNFMQVLSECVDALGDDRPCCLAKELTKKHEEFYRGTLGELAESYRLTEVKGEITLVIGPSDDQITENAPDSTLIRKLLKNHLLEGESPSMAAKIVAKELGVGRQQIYQASIEEARKTSVDARIT